MSAEREIDHQALIRSQIAFYDAHAPQYEDAFTRVGRWDHGSEANRRWLAEWAAVEAVVRAELNRPMRKGLALDIACGSGKWTEVLAQEGYAVTGLDSSSTMLELARERLGGLMESVRFTEANVFDVELPSGNDAIVLGLWLSHVPRALLADFLTHVAGALDESGRVVIVDHFARPETFSDVRGVWPDGDTSKRTTADGSAFVIAKVFWDSDSLSAALNSAGLRDRRVYSGDYFFVHAAWFDQ